MREPAPAISVVVPTYNRRDRLERMLAALAAQEFDHPYEVVVVSDGSTDTTNEYLRSADHGVPVRVVEQSNQGPAAARNRGIEVARGELIVFLDDDVIADRHLLRTHHEAHRDRPALVTIGPMDAPPDHAMSAWVFWEQVMLDRQYRAMKQGEWSATARQFYTGNAAIRRQHLVDCGGFDTGFRRAEDVELAYRLAERGLEFRFCPDAIGHHYAERSYESWRQTAYAYGRNDIVFAGERGQTWIYASIRDKLRSYPRPAGALIKAAVGRPVLARATTASAGTLGNLAYRARLWTLSQWLLSGVYAVAYYRGVTDQLGSRDRLDDLLRTGQVASGVAA